MWQAARAIPGARPIATFGSPMASLWIRIWPPTGRSKRLAGLRRGRSTRDWRISSPCSWSRWSDHSRV